MRRQDFRAIKCPALDAMLDAVPFCWSNAKPFTRLRSHQTRRDLGARQCAWAWAPNADSQAMQAPRRLYGTSHANACTGDTISFKITQSLLHCFWDEVRCLAALLVRHSSCSRRHSQWPPTPGRRRAWSTMRERIKSSLSSSMRTGRCLRRLKAGTGASFSPPWLPSRYGEH